MSSPSSSNKQTKPLTPYDLVRAYPDADLVALAEPTPTTRWEPFIESLTEPHCGDTLFLAIAREIGGEKGIDLDEQLRRLARMADDIQAVANYAYRIS